MNTISKGLADAPSIRILTSLVGITKTASIAKRSYDLASNNDNSDALLLKSGLLVWSFDQIKECPCKIASDFERENF